MNYKKILVTGGAGFVGSNLSIELKKHYPNIEVRAIDNLVRRGSELNIPRLKEYGVKFQHGDVRIFSDIDADCDLIIECSAEPSVMAGVTSSPEYLLNTNINGAINCFELARKRQADIVFLSTSRVYPVERLSELPFKEGKTRFEWGTQKKVGFSKKGIAENFDLSGPRTLYGATKLCAEFVLQEYLATYNIRGVINRFGLISGPWQMGKVDQGVIVLWMAAHIYGKPLSCIGYKGSGKQVRDVLNVQDVFSLINKEIRSISKINGKIINAGGGYDNSVSLLELTDKCEAISGNKVQIKKVNDTRFGDVRIYITDNTFAKALLNWEPKVGIDKTLEDIYSWISGNKNLLINILQ